MNWIFDSIDFWKADPFGPMSVPFWFLISSAFLGLVALVTGAASIAVGSVSKQRHRLYSSSVRPTKPQVIGKCCSCKCQLTTNDYMQLVDRVMYCKDCAHGWLVN